MISLNFYEMLKAFFKHIPLGTLRTLAVWWYSLIINIEIDVDKFNSVDRGKTVAASASHAHAEIDEMG